MIEFFPHQKDALEKSAGRTHVAYYHDMGLGKTFTGAEHMNRLGKRNNIVICQKSKVEDWAAHFEKYYSMSVYRLTTPAGLNAFMCDDERKVGIINYDLVWRRGIISSVEDAALMLDESSLIQNPSTRRTRFILRLRPSAVILLSGTPTDGKYERLWTQAHMLGWGISKREYESEYINWVRKQVGFINPIMIRLVDPKNPYKNVERLKDNFRAHGAQFLKTEECYDLPEQTFINVSVARPSAYRTFMLDSIYHFGNGDVLVGDTPLTKRLRARELCGIYSKEKLAALCDLLDSTGERLVVFYNFTRELRAIKAACDERERPVSIVNGEKHDLTAYEAHEDSVTIVQYRAGAMGLNLQKANRVIYYTLPEESALFEQSKKRVHRIGQERPCYYYVLMCDGTLEHDIYATLKMRKDYTDELFREKYGRG